MNKFKISSVPSMCVVLKKKSASNHIRSSTLGASYPDFMLVALLSYHGPGTGQGDGETDGSAAGSSFADK